MKNIRIYRAEKYGTEQYTEVEPNIFSTYTTLPEEVNGTFSRNVTDKELLDKLRQADGWTFIEEDDGCEMLCYEGKRYYREIYEDAEEAEEANIIFTGDSKYGEDGSYMVSRMSISDEELADKLRQADGWKRGEEPEEEYLVLIYEGKKYYRNYIDPDYEITVNMCDEPELTYMTSIVFETEPELGETKAETVNFLRRKLLFTLIWGYDRYSKENAADPVNTYVEFVSTDIDDIRGVLGIIGKHVYNKEDGEQVILVIE